jgi:UDP-N-acetylglucosamine 2-epimerase (non-hydrolysing)
MIDILSDESPDLVLVQGDTSTAVGAAAAGSFMQIPVGHIEAGLRSGDERKPFPEELHRKQISRMASYHFAPTTKNRRNLLAEGIPDSRIFVTGNTIVDSLNSVLNNNAPSARIDRVLAETAGLKRIVLTMHRRENTPHYKLAFAALKQFVALNDDFFLLFPVHPSPAVRQAAAEVLRGGTRIRLLEPLDYSEFIDLVRHAWIIVTDSGGIQEEAPTLGKLVLLFRAKTERPEAVDTGMVKIIGDSPSRLLRALQNLKDSDTVVAFTLQNGNPFGNGSSAKTIVNILERLWEQPNEIVQKAFFQPARNSSTIGSAPV